MGTPCTRVVIATPTTLTLPTAVYAQQRQTRDVTAAGLHTEKMARLRRSARTPLTHLHSVSRSDVSRVSLSGRVSNGRVDWWTRIGERIAALDASKWRGRRDESDNRQEAGAFSCGTFLRSSDSGTSQSRLRVSKQQPASSGISSAYDRSADRIAFFRRARHGESDSDGATARWSLEPRDVMLRACYMLRHIDAGGTRVAAAVIATSVVCARVS